MYMDSLELSTYGAGSQFWGYHLMEEFENRRGYDLTPYLPFIIKPFPFMSMDALSYHYDPRDKELAVRVRNDLCQTMTELYVENMLQPLQEWLHNEGMTLRAEISYGMPFEISIPGKICRWLETESLEFASQLDSFRNLAGPAHLLSALFKRNRRQYAQLYDGAGFLHADYIYAVCRGGSAYGSARLFKHSRLGGGHLLAGA